MNRIHALRISLLTLFIFITIICGVVALWTNRAQRQSYAVRQLQQLGCRGIYYDFELTPDMHYDASASSHPLADFLGVDFFHDVWVVDLSSAVYDDVLPRRNTLSSKQIPLQLFRALPEIRALHLDGMAHLQPSGFAELASLRKLRVLTAMATPVTDANLREIAACPSLQTLELMHTRLHGDGLAHLCTHQRLQDIDLTGSTITDAACPHLSRMHGLHRLVIEDTDISSEAAAELAESLPSTSIAYSKYNGDFRPVEAFFPQ